jgi:AraC-like DNA-binding protein
MKIQLETIGKDTKSPFRLLHNPNLSALFYWHFHPEYELVYIEGANATRHVGDHISNFEHSDLVFIGSNIPHLNFDYGVKTDYKKDVLHIKTSFKKNVLQETPALLSIIQLFERSQYGIAFLGKTKELVGERLMRLHALSPFDQYLETLTILKLLADSNEYELLHDTPFVNKYNKKEQQRIRQLYAFIDEHYMRKINLDEVAELCNLSKPAFCRYFKKNTGTTFIGFLNEYRISQAKRLLLIGMNVSETCYECGFESLSYFNRTFKSITNENPSTFKKNHLRIS